MLHANVNPLGEFKQWITSAQRQDSACRGKFTLHAILGFGELDLADASLLNAVERVEPR